jgi:hypothetical protein
MTARSAFHDLAAEDFPFTVDFWGPGTDRHSDPPTFTATAEGPGAMQIPALGWPTWCRVTYGDGRVEWQAPPAVRPPSAR